MENQSLPVEHLTHPEEKKKGKGKKKKKKGKRKGKRKGKEMEKKRKRKGQETKKKQKKKIFFFPSFFPPSLSFFAFLLLSFSTWLPLTSRVSKTFSLPSFFPYIYIKLSFESHFLISFREQDKGKAEDLFHLSQLSIFYSS